MRYIKTYGIYGLLEWHGSVKCGSITMNLSFTNGSTTAYGVSPATYITKDEATQFIIENSDKFKSGKIKLISKREFVGAPEKKDEPVVSKVTTPNPPVTNPEPPKNEEGAGEGAGETDGAQGAQGADAGADADAGTQGADAGDAGTEGAQGADVGDAGTEGAQGEDDSTIKVSDKSEAVDWLKSHYPEKGYTATKLRTKEAFLEACKECGVTFEW